MPDIIFELMLHAFCNTSNHSGGLCSWAASEIKELRKQVAELNRLNFAIGESNQKLIKVNSKLKGFEAHLTAIKNAADGQKPLASCQGQAMDRYTELANYRSVVAAIQEQETAANA